MHSDGLTAVTAKEVQVYVVQISNVLKASEGAMEVDSMHRAFLHRSIYSISFDRPR